MIDSFNELVSRAMNAATQGSPETLAALFLVAALTEVGVPFPFLMDSVLLFIGLGTGLISRQAFLIMAALFLGRSVGSGVIFWLTRFFGKPFTIWLGKRSPSLQGKLDRVTARLTRGAPPFVAIARLTPGLLTPSTVAFGAMRLRYDYFVLGVLLSSLAADVFLIGLGVASARGFRYFGVSFSAWMAFPLVIMLFILVWAGGKILSRRGGGEKTVG